MPANTISRISDNLNSDGSIKYGIVVLYILDPPQLTSDDTVFYAAFGSDTVLKMRVRAFPEIEDIESAFLWQSLNKMFSGPSIQNRKLDHDIYLSELLIKSVM